MRPDLVAALARSPRHVAFLPDDIPAALRYDLASRRRPNSSPRSVHFPPHSQVRVVIVVFSDADDPGAVREAASENDGPGVSAGRATGRVRTNA